MIGHQDTFQFALFELHEPTAGCALDKTTSTLRPEPRHYIGDAVVEAGTPWKGAIATDRTGRRDRASAQYFHNGLAADLDAVVEFYDDGFDIGLPLQKRTLVFWATLAYI